MPHAHQATRRTLLSAALSLPAGLLPAMAHSEPRTFNPQRQDWQTYEVSTAVEIPEAQGSVQLWLPVPSLDTSWQSTLDHDWTSNATHINLRTDPQTGARMLHAEFIDPQETPRLRLNSRVRTRDRSLDWHRPRRAQESSWALKQALAPTELLPTDGIVRTTAQRATQGARSDVDKVRALYDWVIAHAHREPSTRGCGLGDIRTMLETGQLSGKCADLNALFVGLCRASDVPAREVYGLRLAPSAFGYRELGARSESLKGAQHCRAEVFLRDYGWVAMDPADVLKVMRQETSEWLRDPAHPLVAPVARGLFGQWEGNWVGWNTAHDLRLHGSRRSGTLPFLMYPQGEDASGQFDELAPDTFKYRIAARLVKESVAL